MDSTDDLKFKAKKLKADFVMYARYVIEGGYIPDSVDKTVLGLIFEAFVTKKEGLIVYSNPGVGKTIFFEILQRVIHPKDKLKFSIVNTLSVVKDFNVAGHKTFDRHSNLNMLYDDLGAETKGQHYGDKLEAMENLIQFRYDLYRRDGIRTFFTTNLKPEEIEDRYGSRCKSRLREMCYHYALNGNDKRKQGRFKGFPNVRFEKTPDELKWEEAYKSMTEKAKAEPAKIITGTSLGELVKKHLG